MLDTTKPHCGTIDDWSPVPHYDHAENVVGCKVVGHTADSTCGFVTGTVRAQDGAEIETLNWRYTLGARRAV